MVVYYCSSGDKEDKDYDYFHDGDDICSFSGTNDADKSDVQDCYNNEFNMVNNHEDLVDDEFPELVKASVPEFNFVDILSSLIMKIDDSETIEDQGEDAGKIRERLHEDDNISTSTV